MSPHSLNLETPSRHTSHVFMRSNSQDLVNPKPETLDRWGESFCGVSGATASGYLEAGLRVKG